MDCEHMIIDLESRVVSVPTLTYAHWFKCLMCHTKACVIEHVVVP